MGPPPFGVGRRTSDPPKNGSSRGDTCSPLAVALRLGTVRPPMMRSDPISVTTSLDTMLRGHNVPYGPPKAGREALIAALAQELEGTGVTANVLVPGGAANTGFFTGVAGVDRAALIQPEVMRAPVAWLASPASDGVNGMRFVASLWDERLPLDQRIAKAGAPAGWPQLGRQAVRRP